MARITDYARTAHDILEPGMQLELSEQGWLRIFDNVTHRSFEIDQTSIRLGDLEMARVGVQVLCFERAEFSNVIHVNFGKN